MPSAAALGGNVALPKASGLNARILYNHFTQRLLAFDMQTRQIQQESDEPNFFQYEFPTPSQYFTAGSSINNGFSVIRVDGSTIDTVVKADADEGVFPLATSGDRRFFTLSKYVDGHETTRRLVELAGRTLTPVGNIGGLIDSGAIVGSDLYYTVLDDKSSKYTLFKVAIDGDGTPQKIRDGLLSGRLYAHSGRLYTADKTSIFNGDDRYSCADLCYFHDDAGVLIRIQVDNNGNLALDVIDSKSKKVLRRVPDAIDYTVTARGVTVYRPGSVTVVRLGGGGE